MKKFYSEEIDQIIQSIDGIEQAEPSAFFYNKLMHKMQQKRIQKQYSFIFQFKPLLVIASLSLLVFINAFMLIKQTDQSHQTIANKSIPTNTVYDFSEDYQLNTTTNY